MQMDHVVIWDRVVLLGDLISVLDEASVEAICRGSWIEFQPLSKNFANAL